MQRCYCGSVWFVERREVIPSDDARPASRRPAPAAAQRFSLVCADCGGRLGEVPDADTEDVAGDEAPDREESDDGTGPDPDRPSRANTKRIR